MRGQFAKFEKISPFKVSKALGKNANKILDIYC